MFENVVSFAFCSEASAFFLFLCLCVFEWHKFKLQVFSSAKCASYFYLDEWAGDIHVNGQLVKATVIGNVEKQR